MRISTLLTALVVLAPLPAAATMTATFRDGAPKDRFTLQYSGDCVLSDIEIEIDLGTAPAGLIFDTTSAGAGVEVFQPLEWVTGTARTTAVTDGDTALTLSLDTIAPGDVLAFTIDIDDTTSTRQITVNGSEMAGATLRMDSTDALFDDTGTAVMALAPCTS
ncbi:MAG: hypothetical protein AAF214_04770 [Pseudomonadota bacterium]